MHLVLSDLGSVVVDAPGVRAVRAEDASGSFGLLPGHADLLTVLVLGVLSWRDTDDRLHHCALRAGVLTLRQGCELQVATRQAVISDDLHHLERDVLTQMAVRQRDEERARREARQLQLRALRELMRPLRPPLGGDVVNPQRLP
jgi:F-type H+-transporting ATPase subunit epsilon